VDIEQVLTYLMQKDQRKVSQSSRQKIGFKDLDNNESNT
jgi:hypothetical protein